MQQAAGADPEVGLAPLLADLDPGQRAAVVTPSTLVAVIAGAGSGKTRVLTRRIAYRIATGTADARHTLALTFTREAAGELRRRLRRSGVRDHVEAGTFHAVALGLLRQRWIDLDQRPPTVVGDRDRLLAEIAAGVPRATLVGEVEWAAARGVPPDGYVTAARAAGRRSATPAERIAERLHDYASLKRRRGVVDLDDLLALACRELRADATWAEIVRWRYRNVLVDEAQDLNPVQHRFLELIVDRRDDLYLVGDPAQAIYGFNGSDPTLLVDVAARLPGVEVIHLPTNHRCTPQIVTAGRHVLHGEALGQDAVSARAEGPPVRLVACDGEDHEAATVAGLLRTTDPALARTGSVAVLARTNAQLVRLAGVIASSGFRIRRRQPAPGSPLATAVRTATSQRSATRYARVGPRRPRGRARTGWRRQHGGGRAPRFAAIVLEFLRDQPFGDGSALRSWIVSADPFASTDTSGVELLTFHGAKGREWPMVIVTGVETGLVPHRTATTGGAHAEEARLLHVAFTRATDHLIVTWATRRGGYRRKPSPLIAGLDVEPAPAVAPPPELRSPPRSNTLDRLVAWRAATARATAVLPTEICRDHDLTAIVAASPRTAEDLAAVTSLGPLTAARHFTAIRAALDG